MRVRITRKPPASYGIDRQSLLVGRIYNLPAAVASALMLDGSAELYDTLTDSEKRERWEAASQTAWTADDAEPRWTVPRRRTVPRRKR